MNLRSCLQEPGPDGPDDFDDVGIILVIICNYVDMLANYMLYPYKEYV